MKTRRILVEIETLQKPMIESPEVRCGLPCGGVYVTLPSPPLLFLHTLIGSRDEGVPFKPLDRFHPNYCMMTLSILSQTRCGVLQ